MAEHQQNGHARGDGTIAEALRRLLAGDTEAGLALYDSYLKVPDLPMPPIGLHAAFLEKAGRSEAATALVAAGVARGKNVAVKAGGFGTDAAAAAEEYAALFARGLANATMVHDYAVALTRLGRTEEVARLFDQARLLRAVRLDARLAGTAAALLLAEEATGLWQETAQSVRRMTFVKQVHRIEGAQALLAALERQAALYLEDWAASNHPLASLVPQAFDIDAWGLISRGDGFNSRHVHRIGWATGVYYPVSVEGEGEEGALRVGAPEALEGRAAGWPAATIRPEAGLLVLMPSFYTHWTVPLGRPGLRLSIAFDLLPKGH